VTGLSGIERMLGSAFIDRSLLTRALTHKSINHKSSFCYERLEFLGDAVLDLITREYLLRKYPEEDEGLLTRRKVKLVCRENLVKQGRRLNLLKHIAISEDVRNSSGRTLDSIIADVAESLIGALYIDRGLDAAERFIESELLEPAADVEYGAERDPRTALQEYCQSLNIELPIYDLMEKKGPEHKPVFRVIVTLCGSVKAEGSGETMKDAIKEAAINALEIIKKEG